MSTRGFVGFKTTKNDCKNGYIYGVYNSHDSYYSSLGMYIFDIYSENDRERLKKTFESIKWIERDYDMYDEDEDNDRDDYPDYPIDAVDLMDGKYTNKKIVNDCSFLGDGLFCEYAYIYNIENDSLELYRGGFRTPPKNTQSVNNEYYTHKVFEITRDCDEDKIRKMFINIEEYIDDFCNLPQESEVAISLDIPSLYNGKYAEEIFMENIELYDKIK